MEEERASLAEPSLLAYLFADRLLGPWDDRYDRRVATLLVAVALWDLQQRGLIALEPERRRFLLWRYDEVMVDDRSPAVGYDWRGTLVASYGLGMGAAFERYYCLDELLIDLVRERHRLSVPSLLRGVINKPVADPWGEVTGKVREGALRRGYMEYPILLASEKRRGRPEPRLNPERLAALERPFAALAARWAQFQVDQRGLHELLSSRCRRGIGLRERSEDSYDPPG